MILSGRVALILAIGALLPIIVITPVTAILLKRVSGGDPNGLTTAGRLARGLVLGALGAAVVSLLVIAFVLGLR